jgi:hypothetical protein
MKEAYHEYRKQRYAAHSAYRQNLDDLAFKTSERYDQWVFTLAGGALAISLTFLEKIAPNPAHFTFILLGISWLAYILAILAGFSAIYYSRKAIYQAIEICDENYRKFNETSTEEKPEGDPQPETENRFNLIVDQLNVVSLSCLVVGTLLMCIFALANLKGTKPTNETEHTNVPATTVNFLQTSNNIVNINKGNP